MRSFREPLVCFGVAVHMLSCGPDWDSLLASDNSDGASSTKTLPSEAPTPAASATANSTSEETGPTSPRGPGLIQDPDAGPQRDAGADGGFGFEMAR